VKETDGILYQKIQSFSLLSNRPIDDVRYELYPRSPNTTKTNAISETLSNECSFRSRKAFVYNGMRYQLDTIEIDRDKNTSIVIAKQQQQVCAPHLRVTLGSGCLLAFAG